MYFPIVSSLIDVSYCVSIVLLQLILGSSMRLRKSLLSSGYM